MGTVPIKKVAKKQSEGWVYVVQWENDPYAVKIGFTTDLKARFSTFLTACRHRLVVLKAFKADMEEEQLLHERFDGCRDSGEWFMLTPGLQRFIQQEMLCHTKEAQTANGAWMKDRVKWYPMAATKRELLEAAQETYKIPAFIANARTYVIWALNDIDSGGFFATSNGIINHPSNKGLYEAKTIYNCLTTIVEEGLAIKNAAKCYRLTELGEKVLLDAEEEYENSRPKRKSAFSTRLGRGMA